MEAVNNWIFERFPFISRVWPQALGPHLQLLPSRHRWRCYETPHRRHHWRQSRSRPWRRAKMSKPGLASFWRRSTQNEGCCNLSTSCCLSLPWPRKNRRRRVWCWGWWAGRVASRRAVGGRPQPGQFPAGRWHCSGSRAHSDLNALKARRHHIRSVTSLWAPMSMYWSVCHNILPDLQHSYRSTC